MNPDCLTTESSPVPFGPATSLPATPDHLSSCCLTRVLEERMTSWAQLAIIMGWGQGWESSRVHPHSPTAAPTSSSASLPSCSGKPDGALQKWELRLTLRPGCTAPKSDKCGHWLVWCRSSLIPGKRQSALFRHQHFHSPDDSDVT